MNCTFSYDSVSPSVTLLERVNSTYRISLTDPTNFGIKLINLTITMLGTPCVNLTGIISNFTC